MNQPFKTILQLVQEKIAKQAALAGDQINLQLNAHEALARMHRRFEQGPALVLLTTHQAQALLAVLPLLPPQHHVSTIQSVIVQVVQDWEDVHKDFEEQLRPNSM